ncbi:retrovirus-related pol polyprotein from transposon TNT 1-94 [Tanacetum coccineum]
MVHHQSYQALTIHQPPQASFPPMDSSFLLSDDPIASSGARSNATGIGVNRNGGANTACNSKVIQCYNCQEEGHMAKKYTKPKRPRNSAWFKEKVMLVEDLESKVVLDEEQMEFLADNGAGQASQEIPSPTTFQTDDLDAFDSDCDEAPSASAVLMAKISSYDLEVLLEVQFRRTSLTRFPAQSIRSTNAIALDSSYLLILITETSQSRQHESRKSPTAELFDVDSGRISIHHARICTDNTKAIDMALTNKNVLKVLKTEKISLFVVKDKRTDTYIFPLSSKSGVQSDIMNYKPLQEGSSTVSIHCLHDFLCPFCLYCLKAMELAL